MDKEIEGTLEYFKKQCLGNMDIFKSRFGEDSVGYNFNNELLRNLNSIKQALTTKSKKEQAFDFLTKNFKVMVGVDKGKDLDFACLMFSAKDMKKVFWLAGAYKQQDLKTYNQLLELKEVLNDNSQE